MTEDEEVIRVDGPFELTSGKTKMVITVRYVRHPDPDRAVDLIAKMVLKEILANKAEARRK